jgi:hypothetical protein
VSARDEIEDQHARYAWAFDMDELGEIGDCFVADAEVEFGNGAVAVGRDAIVAALEQRRAAFRERAVAPWHVMSNLLLREARPDRIEATCFYTFFTKPADRAPQPEAIGYYEDRFVAEVGAWRLQRRRIVSGGAI